MKPIVRNAVFTLISCLIAVSTLFFMHSGAKAETAAYEKQPIVSAYGESVVEIKKAGAEEWAPAAPKQPLLDGDSVRTADVSEAVINFDSEISARMASNTEILVSDSVFKLIEGEAWINGAAALSEFNFEVGDAKISAADAVFDAFAQDENIVISVVSGNIAVNGDTDLLVNAGNQITFAPETVKSKIDSSWISNDWYIANSAKDKQEKNLIAKELKEQIQKSGANYGLVDSANFSIRKFLRNARSLFVFSDRKAKDSYLSFVSNLIDDGVYYFSVDDKQNGTDTFLFVFNFIKNTDPKDMSVLKNLLFDKFKKLKIFSRFHGNIYLAREKARDLLLGFPVYNALAPKEKLYLVRTFLYDAVAEYDYSEANNLLSQYFENLLRALQSDRKNFSKYIAEDNAIAYETMIDNVVFYKKRIFELKSKLEKNLSGQDKKNLDKEKIDFLKNLKEFALNEEISAGDALAISSLLDKEIADKKSFESDLARLSDFFAFLADKTYANSPIYGATVSDRFLAYLDLKRQGYQVEELKKSLMEKEQTAAPEIKADFENIKKIVSAKFEENGIKIEEFGEAEDANMKYIAINKAVKGGVVFSAKYNRDADIVSDIITEDGYEFPLGVEPSKVGAALSKIIEGGEHASAPLPFEEISVESIESPMEASAKALIVEKLAKFDIKADAGRIFVVNLATKEFKVQNAEIENKKEKILINFDFKDPFTNVSNIELNAKKGPVAYGADKTISLQDLSPKMIEFAEKNYYEQLDKEIEEAKE